MKQKILFFFNENEYDILYPSGSAPALIYGTPKLHKFSSSNTYPKLREVASSIGAFNYDLVHFLCDPLSPVPPDGYSCKDTFSFVSKIKNVNLSGNFLVSYVLTSLFTKTPLEDTTGIVINLHLNHNPNPNITKSNLKNFPFFATSQIHFLFNGNFYNQVDWVAKVKWVFTNLNG